MSETLMELHINTGVEVSVVNLRAGTEKVGTTTKLHSLGFRDTGDSHYRGVTAMLSMDGHAAVEHVFIVKRLYSDIQLLTS